jgi:hypothetical protein
MTRRAAAQEANRRILTSETWVRPQDRSDICDEQTFMGATFIRALWFRLTIFISSIAPYLLTIALSDSYWY